MKKFLKKIFKKQHSLYTAIENGNEEEFCQIFLDSDIFVLDGDIGEGLPIDSSPDDILKQVETRAEDFANKTETQLFAYNEDGKWYFPFFLSQKYAELFCGAFCGRENRLFAFQMLQLKGSEIIGNIEHYDKIIMNDQSDEEFELPPGILSKLKNKKC